MRVYVTQTNTPPALPSPVTTGLVAQPGGLSGGTVMMAAVNIFTNVASGATAVLTNITGNSQKVVNAGTFPLEVYAPSGTQFFGQSVGAGVLVSPGGNATFVYDNLTTWYPT